MTGSVHLVSLGCARNQVDSETMLGRLSAAGWRIVAEPAAADAIVVNTCSFIRPAVDESIDTILELAEFKHKGRCRRLVVVGCLPERFREEIVAALPEVDAFLGTGGFDRVVAAVTDSSAGATACHLPDPDLVAPAAGVPRWRAASPSAYLKIAEGCDRHCTYCIIPKLRGPLRSRELADILKEAENLIAKGFRELVVIGQDTGSYGRDRGASPRLPDLLAGLAEISTDVWIRFLYGSPDTTDARLIRTMAAYPNICPYFDVPIQHASAKILKRMGRPYDADALTRVFAAIRGVLPEAALRTTVMVGFPGETEKDFAQLLEFITSVQFDHLGAFLYSDADDLPSHQLSGHVPKSVARSRFDALMGRQQEISAAKNQARVGRVYPVLVEEVLESGLYAGRTPFQAPDVDGIVYIDAAAAVVGDIMDVRITDAMEYDLRGEAR